MGSFQGHILPGFFMLLFGIRAAYYVLTRYYANLPRKQDSVREKKGDFVVNSRSGFRSYPFYNYSCILPDTATDAYLCVLFTVIGFIGEFATAFEGGKFVHIHNLQHMLMYTAFGTAGFAAIKTWNKSSVLPHGSDYAALLLSLFVEALLFVFHLHGRSMIDIHVHQLLVITIVAAIIASAMEWRNRDHPLPALFRSYCLLLQGSWFCQIGFILYNPLPGAVPWSDSDHNQMMLVTSLFVVHMMAALFALCLFASFIHSSSCCHSAPDYDYHCIVATDSSDLMAQEA